MNTLSPLSMQILKAFRSLPVYVILPPALIWLFGFLIYAVAGTPEEMNAPGVEAALRFWAALGFFVWVCRQVVRFLWFAYWHLD
jgi:hypothetical protein